MNPRAVIELLNELRKELTAKAQPTQDEWNESRLREKLSAIGFFAEVGENLHDRTISAIEYLESARDGDRKQLALAVERIGQLEAEQKQILTAANQLARRVNTAVQALAGPLPGSEQAAQDPGTPDGGEPQKPCKPCDEQRAAARDLAGDGADAFDQGKYADAIDKFSRAESLVHAVPHL